MSVTATPLFQAQFAPASTTNVYTSPSQTTTIIDKFTATNITGSSVALTIYIVPSGGSPAASNAILDSFSVTANTTMNLDQYLRHVLAPGDYIAALAATGSAVVIRGSGRQAQ